MKDVTDRKNRGASFFVALAVLLASSSSASFCRTELRHPVNLILQDGQTVWKDPRGPLSRKAQELGLSPEEVQRIRKNVGYVICPGNPADGGALASEGAGMLVGNGHQIVTDAHLFIDTYTNKRREPLEDCRFINLADPSAIVRLDFSSEKTYKFYTLFPEAVWYNDRAIVRLTHRILGADPFPLDLDETPLKRGDRLIMISADQNQLTFSMPRHHILFYMQDHKFSDEMDVNSEPIAQACTVMAYYARTARASSVIYSDCNGTAKASGSIVLIRKPNGNLAAKALHTQGGKLVADYKPFKVGSGVGPDNLSFALSIGLDANVYDDIMAMERANE
ncbi:hypothetical protein [Nitrobacter sp.]|uniref:hypothetical protein n=1 Tax=Nitrobacter sp. TaxID=29420 RepID=UPI003F64E2FD